jgi:hypothetical protein
MAFARIGAMWHVIGSMWHGFDLDYVPCGMSYVMFRCHVGWFKLNICATWPRPNICGMSYALPRCHMAWPIPSICTMWHVIA